MIVRRKFNLRRVGEDHAYEMLDIEVEADTAEECARQIEEAWRVYCSMIGEGKIQ